MQGPSPYGILRSRNKGQWPSIRPYLICVQEKILMYNKNMGILESKEDNEGLRVKN